MTDFNAVAAKNTEQAPKGFGPSSQTVAFSHYNNLSAQLPIDPKIASYADNGRVEDYETDALKELFEQIEKAPMR